MHRVTVEHLAHDSKHPHLLVPVASGRHLHLLHDIEYIRFATSFSCLDLS